MIIIVYRDLIFRNRNNADLVSVINQVVYLCLVKFDIDYVSGEHGHRSLALAEP